MLYFFRLMGPAGLRPLLFFSGGFSDFYFFIFFVFFLDRSEEC